MKKSVSKRMFALSALISAGILLTGCSGTEAEPSESTPMGSSTEAVQGSVGGAESGTNHISEKLSDLLVIDAEVVLPKEQVYSVYALTMQAFAREDLDVFFWRGGSSRNGSPGMGGGIFCKNGRGRIL